MSNSTISIEKMDCTTKKIVSIEGNIGSGKSTLVDQLQKNFAGSERVCFLQEPVDIWNTIQDKEGNTMITKFYSDTKKYSFAFQMMAYISRLSMLREAIKKDYNVIVVERSMFTDKMVFAKMLYDDGKIEEVEYQIYNKWFDEFIQDLPPIDIVYVKTSPSVALERVEKRAREGESIPLAYLENCHNYHENWLKEESQTYRNKIVIQGDTDIEKDPAMLNNWLLRCKLFIN
tara:strand:- start:1111 stop:1803 length:693 start_codon:yes stop_codon:yes gene_type:complete